MSEILNIYDEDFFWAGRAKNFIKAIAGRRRRGPYGVEQSLLSGLKELNQPYSLNPKTAPAGSVACVLSGVKTLNWAIKQKEQSKISKIIAGPNIALPKDSNGIIFHPAIDVFLVPSSWVEDFCESFHPGFKQKIKIWAAGVDTLPLASSSRRYCLIYQKNINGGLIEIIKQTLETKDLEYIIIKYGQYNKDEYLTLLAQAKFAIFLSASESQGIALNEAWMMDVPTLVYAGSRLKTENYEFAQSSSAPYLTESSGIFFGKNDFALKLEAFLAKLATFSPRQYHLDNFTNKITAENFLKIVREVKK